MHMARDNPKMLKISSVGVPNSFRRCLELIKYLLIIFVLTLSFSEVLAISAQPIAFGEFEVGSKLVYRLSGVYIGNKTYEFLSIDNLQGRTCIRVRVKLDVRTQGGLLSKGTSYISEFCYDERGRPVSQRMDVPPELNSSIREVEVIYQWEEGYFPNKAMITLHREGNITEVYELDMIKGQGTQIIENERVEFSFSPDNLSKILPFVPEALVAPHIDLSSLELKKGFEKILGEGVRGITLKVMGSDYIETPAGRFECYIVLLKGVDEYGIPYNSTLYITKARPRFTVMYETNSIGVKQYGWLVEYYTPGKISTKLLFVLPILSIILVMLIIRKYRR